MTPPTSKTQGKNKVVVVRLPPCLVGLTDCRRRHRWTPEGTGSFKTKREADAAARQLLTRIDAGGDAFPEEILFRDLVRRWLGHKASRVRPRTLERYRSLLERDLVPALGNMELKRIKPAHVQQVLDDMAARGMSARTIIQARAVLGGTLRAAVAWGLIAVNPVTAVHPPKAARPRLSVPTREQLAALIEASRETTWEIALLLACTTGARRSEVLGLAWSAVDLKAGRIRIVRTLQKGEGGREPQFLEPKTDRSRRELVLLPVAERLRRHRAEQLERRMALGEGWHDLDLVCDRGDGMWLTPDAFTDAFKRLRPLCRAPCGHTPARLQAWRRDDHARQGSASGHRVRSARAQLARVHDERLPARDRRHDRAGRGRARRGARASVRNPSEIRLATSRQEHSFGHGRGL